MRRESWNKLKWTDDEIGFLLIYNDRYTIDEMSKILGKSVRSIKRKCYEDLNLYKGNDVANKHRSDADKRRGTDLSYEYVKNEALKYNTRVEFWQGSPNAYHKANLMGWTDELCGHMVSKCFSLPQLMLKSYLEQIFNQKCSYNDREAIRPYEIDCYFPELKIGWEYNGIRFHSNNKNDSIKRELARTNGIKLFYINEKPGIKKYEEFIKSVLKEQIDEINNFLTDRKIDVVYIDGLKANVEYPNVLTALEISQIKGKKLSEIKKVDNNLYRKIIKYNLFDKFNVENDKRILHKFNSIDEYVEYIKSKNYKDFREAYTKQHIHRVCKKLGCDVDIIRNIYE